MSKPKTANQYLASIGIGPVNPVCGRCGKETGRVYTADGLCVDCLIKQGQIIPQRSARPRHCSNCGQRLRADRPNPYSASCGCDE